MRPPFTENGTSGYFLRPPRARQLHPPSIDGPPSDLRLCATQGRSAEVVDALAARIEDRKPRRILNESPLPDRLPRRRVGIRLGRRHIVSVEALRIRDRHR